MYKVAGSDLNIPNLKIANLLRIYLPKLLIKKRSLPKSEGLARAAGLEPAISGVTGQRDNQLRYARVMFVILYETLICVNNKTHFFLNFFYFFSRKILRILLLNFKLLCMFS